MKTIMSILKYVYLILSVLFLYASVAGMVRYYFHIGNDKISGEFYASLFYSISSLIYSGLFLLQYIAILRKQKWFIYVYWTTLIFYMTWLLALMGGINIAKMDTRGFGELFIFFGIPALIGIFLRKLPFEEQK